MPLILVQNEITAGNKYDHWQDDEGVQYHFPNQYIGKVREGEVFIYYRGSRRADNKRGIPEYFGCGKIGKVWLDPLTDIKKPRYSWHWYCEIVDYIPFKYTVPFKIGDTYLENIPKNLWSVAVRNISLDVYKAILKQASIEVADEDVIIKPNSPIFPKIDEVNPAMVTAQNPLMYLPQSKKESNGRYSGGESYGRYSKYSKLFGDRAEEIVYQLLTKEKADKLRWVAKEKEKPGWDIEYHDGRNLIAIEVKGTSGKRFLSIDITAGEWGAAQKIASNYRLYLVADCLSIKPQIQVINNPYSLFLKRKLSLTPIAYRLQLSQ
jgi:hypothetical protein